MANLYGPDDNFDLEDSQVITAMVRRAVPRPERARRRSSLTRFTDALSGAITLLIGTSGLIGGGAHYAAVLARKTEQEIEQATAF